MKTLFVAPMAYSVVGGHLTQFLDAWTALGTPQSVLRILGDDYSLWLLRPLSVPLPSQFTVITKPVQVKVVDEEVAALLAKQAIWHVPRTSLGLVCRMFVVPKKDGG